jgi:Arylsulfotransferase (ASST)
LNICRADLRLSEGDMRAAKPTMTRRELIRRGGVAAAGVALAGGLGELAAGALLKSPAPPTTPHWVTRPDLRIPGLTVTRRERGVSDDPIFIAPYNAPNGAQAGAVIVDNEGRPLWENPIASKVTTNFRVQSYRASPVLTWWEGTIELGHGVGEYVIADSSYDTIRRVQAGHGLRGDLHEFVLTPRDTALLTSYVVRKADLRAVGGAAAGTIQDALFQEIDLTSGEVLLEWHSLDNVELSESYAPVSADWDFFHINSVDLDHDGNLLVSSRSMHTIYKVDRGGQILWRLGGKKSDFQIGPGAGFAWQHDARRQPDGTLTVFDNGATPAVERRSRGLILDVDEQAMTSSLVRQYTHPGVLSGSQGSVQRLSNGNVFIGWGEIPRVSEFDESGRLIFDALLGSKHQSYRAFRLPWSGLPAQAPAIAVHGTRSRPTVYASWNGATGVHAWRLLTGPAPNSLSAHSQTLSSGFESALSARGAGAYVAVEALDAARAPLGRSAPVALPS